MFGRIKEIFTGKKPRTVLWEDYVALQNRYEMQRNFAGDFEEKAVLLNEELKKVRKELKDMERERDYWRLNSEKMGER